MANKPAERSDGFTTQALVVIWIGIILTLVVYGVLAHLIGPGLSEGGDPNPQLDMLRTVLGIAAAVMVMTSLIIRRKATGSDTMAGVPASMEQSGSRQPSFQRYAGLVVLSLALAESVALFGLVLCLLGDAIAVYYWFAIPAAIIMLVNRPGSDAPEESGIDPA